MTGAVFGLLRGVSGIVALVAGYYALYLGVDVFYIVTRPVNQGWIELLVLMLLPVFIGVAALAVMAGVLGRYAWRGKLW